MSIHSLAKELGVSEYALRKYAEQHNLQRTREKNNRRCGYKFTEEDLKFIKLLYSEKKNPSILFLMFRLYDKVARNHLYLPAGVFTKNDEELLKQFVSMQYSRENIFKEKCYNFFICSRRQYETRIKKLQNAFGDQYFNLICKELKEKIITPAKLSEYVDTKTRIKFKDFAPKVIQTFFYDNTPRFISLDEQLENGFELSSEDVEDFDSFDDYD